MSNVYDSLCQLQQGCTNLVSTYVRTVVHVIENTRVRRNRSMFLDTPSPKYRGLREKPDAIVF